jgi:hypothetical protein
MKNNLILAAVAFLAIAATGAASAKTHALSAEDLQVCLLLELAHESSCAEYEAKLVDQYAATATPSDDVTGSIERPAAEAVTR